MTMGLLSVPTMLRRNYQKELATGTVAASGTLGQIFHRASCWCWWVTLSASLWAICSSGRFFPACFWFRCSSSTSSLPHTSTLTLHRQFREKSWTPCQEAGFSNAFAKSYSALSSSSRFWAPSSRASLLPPRLRQWEQSEPWF